MPMTDEELAAAQAGLLLGDVEEIEDNSEVNRRQWQR